MCWNVVLASWLRATLEQRLRALGSPAADAVTADPIGAVVVTHAAGLVASTWDPASPPSGVEESSLYREWLPERLTPLATGGEFDLLVTDEAQDLSETWVIALSQLVARHGSWFAFTDRQQDPFGSDAALPDFLEVEHPLAENFRNSHQIAAFVAGFGEIERDCLTGDGPPVRFVVCRSGRVVGRADEVARNRPAAATRARSLLVVVGDPEVAAAYGFTDLAAGLGARRHPDNFRRLPCPGSRDRSCPVMGTGGMMRPTARTPTDEEQRMSDTMKLTEEDIETQFQAGSTTPRAQGADDADGADSDGSDGDAKDASDGDAADAGDGTDADGADN